MENDLEFRKVKALENIADYMKRFDDRMQMLLRFIMEEK